MEKTEHAAFYMYQKMVFLTYPLNPKAVEGVGGHCLQPGDWSPAQRGCGFQSILTSFTGQVPSDSASPPQGKSIGLDRGLWPDLETRVKWRHFKNIQPTRRELRRVFPGLS